MDGGVLPCPLLVAETGAEDAMDAADESEGRGVTDLVPPWTVDDGSWAALMSKSIELKRLFHAAAMPPDRPAAPPSEAAEGEAAPPIPVDPDVAAEAASVRDVARADAVVAQLLTLDGLVTDTLSQDMVVGHLAQGQGERLTAETDTADLEVDFDEFLTVLWLCVRARFGVRTDGYIGRVSSWVQSCSKLQPPPPPEPEPEPVAAPKKKDKKGK